MTAVLSFSSVLRHSLAQKSKVFKAWTRTQQQLQLQHASPRPLSTMTLNINNALKKAEEGGFFQDLPRQSVTALQGIGPKHAQELESLGLKTIQQLADYKFFHLAKSLSILAKVEEADGRAEGAVMNLSKGIDKEFQNLSLNELLDKPIYVLKGISPEGGEIFQSMGVKTVADLATFKYCQWAEAMVVAGRFEDV